MLLTSPRSLHYPVTVTELLHPRNADIPRDAPLFSYAYRTKKSTTDWEGTEHEIEEESIGRFESEIEGRIVKWEIDVGSVIAGPGAPLVEIEEPCTHDVQFHGMCTRCGKDMFEVDYNTSSINAKRADVKIPFADKGLLVSQAELRKIESDAKRRLLTSEKLSLVVDLDQTVIHATVDPTVGEWMKDDTDPNHDAVKDCRYFQLQDENGQWVWYYIKMRPGLKEFFESISKIYELRIYTMGTRNYALEIAKIIDPDQKLFGDRILSRTDIPQSQKHKSLRDLFPVDTKMAVIIDDRGDVWNYSDYLVKVVPYEFFVGIGDIHSPFLPKVAKKVSIVDPSMNPNNAIAKSTSNGNVLANTSNGVKQDNQAMKSEKAENDEQSPISQILSMNADSEKNAALQTKELTAQVEERPLMQLQRELDQQDEEAAAEVESNGSDADHAILDSQKSRNSVLHDDDEELIHLERVLSDIHERFFESFKELTGNGETSEMDLALVPDVKDIIASMKRELQVLQNTVLVFSKIAPMGTNVADTTVGRLAANYGATISKDVDSKTTHLVTIPDIPPDPRKNEPSKIIRPATSKVNAADRNPKTKIVPDPFIFDSSVSFKPLNEGSYEIRVVDPPNSTRNGEHDEELPVEPIDDSADDEISGDDTIERPSLQLNVDSESLITADTDDTPAFSPIDEIDDAVWEDGDAELEMMSDDSDSDNDVDGDDTENLSDDEADDGESDRSQGQNVPDQPIPSTTTAANNNNNKRKRHERNSSNPSSEAEESETDATRGLGSELQRRKKRALARSSSLTTMSLPNDTSASATNGAGTSSAAAASYAAGRDGKLAVPATAAGEDGATDDEEERRIAAELGFDDNDDDWG